MTPATSRKLWLIVSTLGLALGIPGGLVLGAPLEVLIGAMLVTPVMLGLAGGLLGGSQWIALRGRLPGARWVGLTTVGFAAGFTTAVVLIEQVGAAVTGEPVRLVTVGAAGLAVSMIVLGLVGGGILGFAQSFSLRSMQGARREWTTATVVGLSLGFLSGGVLATAVGGIDTAPGLVAFLLTSGLVYAAVTGRAMNRIITGHRTTA